MIRILIVDDSPTMRMLLKSILEGDPELLVVGVAANGAEAVEQTILLKPDLITMDVLMPIVNGFEATRRIMAQQPTPIVVVTSHIDSVELNTTFNAISAGALDVIAKPVGPDHRDFERLRNRLINTVKLMADVKVVRRRFAVPAPSAWPPTPPRLPSLRAQPAVIVIGASTGGPSALKTLLQALPPNLPTPIVVVQHMASGFTPGLVAWLDQTSPLPIRLAANGQRIEAGQVYFAPDDWHLEFKAPRLLSLNQEAPVSHVRPSVTRLFESAARVYGSAVIGVLLTGMGDDGATGLARLHALGAPTIAQDETTAVIFGMPKVAVELGAVEHLLPLDEIGPMLLKLLGQHVASLTA